MNSVSCSDQLFTPSKIICVGRNYVDHIHELNNEVPDNMVLFLKPNSAISPELSAFDQEPLHYEAELCFLVQNNRFFAVAIGLDLTKRTLQSQLKNKGLPWERAKAFDGSALFSDFVELADDDLEQLSFELTINDIKVQAGNIELMIYKPREIQEEILSFMSLSDGDIVMTGTPKGVGQVNPGDVFTGKVSANGHPLLSKTWLAR
ncbi:fumarylacetoacetate hydrolase family protein [Thalassomonas actiniarum]|uniref:Fumarylacetoacetate hydrolase family protein n=1 Tax=Thalassomonas actiniarum TaxID=485447 RepID=A0AAE9YMR1_9GAMM|nr:fumarylacetoacetate hydrolase family protein [Thalassomonas actiniarum]WDD97662.1 fumarylacetoacetate hydrolase family protein [Thalassomonas actiniarum]